MQQQMPPPFQTLNTHRQYQGNGCSVMVFAPYPYLGLISIHQHKPLPGVGKTNVLIRSVIVQSAGEELLSLLPGHAHTSINDMEVEQPVSLIDLDLQKAFPGRGSDPVVDGIFQERLPSPA